MSSNNCGASATSSSSSSSTPAPSTPLPPFCPSNLQRSDFADRLDESAISFLDRLDLPPVHPLCLGSTTCSNAGDGANGLFPSPPTGEYVPTEALSLENVIAAIITLYAQVAPALLAMAELWLRLFAFVLAPLSAAYLILDELMHWFGNADKSIDSSACLERWRHRLATSSTILGLASSAVLLTDSLYVHEYGRSLGLGFFVLLTTLSTRTYFRRQLSWAVALILVLIKFVVAICLLRSQGGPTLFDHPGLDIPTTVQEGLHYNVHNPLVASIVKHWPETYRVYTAATGATPYLPTGDAKTGIPFLINSSPHVTYRRVWANNPEDGEHVALDIAFPDDRYHNIDKPVYLLLHGLNGGSSEEYIREFVWRRTKENCTCIVMVARGLMDSPVVGWNVFHGARISDVHSAAGHLRKALSDGQLLAGVGYSLGAIVLSNYVTRSGEDCHLDAAMAISGGLDMREQINFYRSQRLWQPFLAKELRDTFIVGKFDARYRHRLTTESYLELMRSASISDIDTHGVVTYNGFDDLMHYYAEMSAFGDHTICINRGGGEMDMDSCPVGEETFGIAHQIGRLSNIAIPLAVVHALDDPLITWRSVAQVDPKLMVNSGGGNLMLLFTKGGGHVGWPLSLNPSTRGWEWMNNCARDFVNAVVTAKSEVVE